MSARMEQPDICCTEHTNKTAQLWCKLCEKIICLDCMGSCGKHRNEDGHVIVPLTDGLATLGGLFNSSKERFDICHQQVAESLATAEKRRDAFERSLDQVKRHITETADTLIAVIDEQRKQELERADREVHKIREKLQIPTTMLTKEKERFEQMHKSATQEMDNVFRLELCSRMKEACERSRKTLADINTKYRFPQVEVRLLSHPSNRDRITRYLEQEMGSMSLAQLASSPEFSTENIVPEFTCTGCNPESVVLSIAVSSTFSNIFITWKDLGDESKRNRFGEFSREGKCLQAPQFLKAKGIEESVLFWSGKAKVFAQCPVTNIDEDAEELTPSSQAQEKQAPVHFLQKQRAAGVFKVMEKRHAQASSAIPLFDISVQNPTRICSSKQGTLFAVLAFPPVTTSQENLYSLYADPNESKSGPKSAVHIFKKGDKRSSASFSLQRPTGGQYLLSAICFAFVQGTEILLVSDSLNGCIYEVEVQQAECRKRRTILPPCGLMTCPTALATEDDGTVWIGCKGGHVLTWRPGGRTSMCNRPKQRPPVPTRPAPVRLVESAKSLPIYAQTEYLTPTPVPPEDPEDTYSEVGEDPLNLANPSDSGGTWPDSDFSSDQEPETTGNPPARRSHHTVAPENVYEFEHMYDRIPGQAGGAQTRSHPSVMSELRGRLGGRHPGRTARSRQPLPQLWDARSPECQQAPQRDM